MNLKQLFLSLGMSGILVLTVACKKVLDVEPEYVKEGTEMFKKIEDHEAALTGAYALFKQSGYFGSGSQTTSSWALLPDMMGEDLVRTSADLGNWLPQANFTYNSTESNIEVSWVIAYRIITQANLVLRNLDKYASKDGQRVNNLKGQALAIRAMVHFDLLRYWGVKFDRNSISLGVPYKNQVNHEEMPKRLSVKETYDNIFKDMLEAEALLNEVDNSNTANRAFIDKWVVKALLARIYLYANDYDAADRYATEVIDAFPLASASTFPLIWKDASFDEVIWSVVFNEGEGSPSTGVHVGSSNTNRFRPSIEILDLYDQVNDIRFNAYFASRPQGASAPILLASEHARRIVKKYIGRSTNIDNVVNWKVIRTSEMYLIRSEARAKRENPDVAKGIEDLNTLRAARIVNYTPISDITAAQLIDSIMIERRKELFAEGHRFFDLKRTTLNLNRRADKGLDATVETLEPASKAWVWPIPYTEIINNPNINPEHQSPGY